LRSIITYANIWGRDGALAHRSATPWTRIRRPHGECELIKGPILSAHLNLTVRPATRECVPIASRKPHNMPPQKPDIEATDPELSGTSSKPSLNDTQLTEDAHARHESVAGAKPQASVATKLRNPLAGMTEQEVIRDVNVWVEEKGLAEYRDEFQKGALIARVGQRDDGFEYVSQLNEEEKELLRHEITHRWDHPFMLYFLVVLCAGSAIVQGMDQTAVNGAQVRSPISKLSFLLTNIACSSTTLRSSISRTSGCKVREVKFNNSEYKRQELVLTEMQVYSTAPRTFVAH
jgi:hypothetical protein